MQIVWMLQNWDCNEQTEYTLQHTFNTSTGLVHLQLCSPAILTICTSHELFGKLVLLMCHEHVPNVWAAVLDMAGERPLGPRI